jgi:hypothetical protein
MSTLSVTTNAKIVSTPVEYKHGDAVLEGWIAYDDAIR